MGKLDSHNYSYPGFYPGIIQVRSNKPIPYGRRIDDKFQNPEIQLQLTIDKNNLPHTNKYRKKFGSAYGEFDGHEIYYSFYLSRGIGMNIRLQNLESNKPIMCITPSSWRLMRMMEWVSRAYRYLLDVETATLLNHNYYPLHCAAVSKNGQGILIVAPSDTGKTCAVLRAAERGYKLIAEERVIFDGVKLYPGLMLGDKVYSGLYLARTNQNIKGKMRRQVLFRTMKVLGVDKLRLLSQGLGGSVILDSCETEPCILSHVIFLEPGTENLSAIDRDDALRRLHDNNKAEFTWRSNTVLRAYSYFNPDFNLQRLEERENSIINSILKCPSVYICRAKDPFYFFEQIEKVVSGFYKKV